jgi:hypothetical protein
MDLMLNQKREKSKNQVGLYKVISLLILILSLTLYFGGCGGPTEIAGSEIKAEDQNNGIATKDWETVSLYSPLSITDSNQEHILSFANRLMEGYLVVEDSLYDEAIEFDAHKIDWDMQVTSSPNTFSLWLHTLNPVYYLSNAYVQTGNNKYIELAEVILNSWLQYDGKLMNKNRYTWYDHSVAVRSENLIYYALVYKNLTGKTNSDLVAKIKKHAEWLSKESNYIKNHNHGIFEDGALIKCGYFLNEQNYIYIGIERLDKQLQYAYPNKAVHTENSTGYHIGLISYLKQLSSYLSAVENSYSSSVKEYFTGALEYLVYAYLPNLALPSIGDTYGADVSGRGSIESYENEKLRYIATKGKEGQKPEETFRIFKNDGYTFFRESWDSNSFEESTWLMFKSGFNSITHKHNDDLSIALYSKGYDIFIDPGMYNYMVGNNIHDYLNSSFAHNAIIVDDLSYPIAKNITEKAGILDYKATDQFKYVKGYNNLYETVLIDRSVIFVDGNTIFLVDDIISESNHKYTQNFHLSDHMQIVKKQKDYVLLKIADTNWYVLLRQLDNIDTVELIEGLGNGTNDSSVRSIGLGKIKDTTSLRFNTQGKNRRFITSIQIIDESELNILSKDEIKVTDTLLTYKDNTIDIASRDRLLKDEVTAKIDGHTITLSHKQNESSKTLSYCYYIIDTENNQIIKKTDYNYDSEYAFTLDKKGEYAVISYIKNEYGERIKYLSGFIKYKNGSYAFQQVPLSESVPYVTSHDMKQLSRNQYSFEINTIGFSDLSVSWYIYKNGASYDYIKGGNKITYTFTEPGTYTCIYRVYDKYFYEVLKNNFNEIVIQ